jgi:hypothetical protein
MSVYLGSTQIQSPPKMYVGETLVTAQPWWLAGGIHPSHVVAAYQPKGAASLAESYINLANPSAYQLSTIYGSPSLVTANGWFLESSCIKTNIYPTNNTTVAIRYTSENAQDYRILVGVTDGSGIRYRYYPSVANKINVIRKDSFLHTTNLISGTVVISDALYVNGVSVLALPTTAFTLLQDLYIGMQNNSGATQLASAIRASVQCVAVYNTILNSAQALAITNAMNAL